MAITIQERDLMYAGIQRPLSSLLATKKEYTWDAKPTAAEFGSSLCLFVVQQLIRRGKFNINSA